MAELALAAGDRPFTYAQRLTNLAKRWLQPEIRSTAGTVERVVLEWFLGGLPTAMAAWVRCYRPSRLEAAVTLAEDHLVQFPAPMQEEKPEPTTRIASDARNRCWWCGQLGHFRSKCLLMEVGQVVQVVGQPTSAHGLEGAYYIPVRVQGIEHRALMDLGRDAVHDTIEPGSTRDFGDGSLGDNQVRAWG